MKNLKTNYRRKIVRHIIHQIDTTGNITATTLAKSAKLPYGMHMLKTAWQEVKTTSIINCFRKAGFELTTVDMQEPDNSQSNHEGMREAKFESYVDLDAAVDCHGAYTDSDIVDAVHQKNQPEGSDSEEDDHSPPPPKTKPSAV